MERFLFIMALMFLCFISPNFAQQPTTDKLFEIRGVVKNQDKVSLAGLNLFLNGNELRNTVVSDENGAFTVKLPVGKFKVTANEAVSKNFTAFVETSDSNLNPNDFELILETKKFCCSQMSDGNVTEVVKYVAPVYPAAAQAVRARGEVVVKVKIGKEGNVISAKAEIGHPLLRMASEAAARLWLFSSDENGIEREGTIVFAFVPVGKKEVDIFTRPNRLEIFSELPRIL